MSVVSQVVLMDEHELGNEEHGKKKEYGHFQWVLQDMSAKIQNFSERNHVHEREEDCNEQEIEQLWKVQARLVVASVPDHNAFIDNNKSSKAYPNQNVTPYRLHHLCYQSYHLLPILHHWTTNHRQSLGQNAPIRIRHSSLVIFLLIKPSPLQENLSNCHSSRKDDPHDIGLPADDGDDPYESSR